MQGTWAGGYLDIIYVVHRDMASRIRHLKVGGIMIEKEILYGNAKGTTTRILGEEHNIHPAKLMIRVLIWIMDDNGKPMRDPETGEIEKRLIIEPIEEIEVYERFEE